MANSIFNFLGGPNLCCEVLQTATQVIRNLPPLSLASDNQITPLGCQGLQDIVKFLRQAALPTSGSDKTCKDSNRAFTFAIIIVKMSVYR